MSSLYTGSISDKEITRVSGLLDLLEPGDTVMADKGFEIGDMLREKGIGLNHHFFIAVVNLVLSKSKRQSKLPNCVST